VRRLVGAFTTCRAPHESTALRERRESADKSAHSKEVFVVHGGVRFRSYC